MTASKITKTYGSAVAVAHPLAPTITHRFPTMAPLAGANAEALPMPRARASCATMPDQALNVQTQQVLVDRPVACVRAADIPTPPAALPARPADARAALDLAIAKVLAWQGYGEKADPLLRNCAVVP